MSKQKEQRLLFLLQIEHYFNYNSYEVFENNAKGIFFFRNNKTKMVNVNKTPFKTNEMQWIV